MEKNIAVIYGDCASPEIVTQALRVLDAVAAKFGHTFTYEEVLLGGCATDAVGKSYPDGTAENADMRIIPCSISSQEKVNDFKPTPKDADGAQALLARLDQLNAQFEKAFSKTGVSAVSPYPTEWKYAY